MIEIEYDDREVRAALERLARAGRDLRPVMREIAAALEAEAQRSFERQRSPEGKPWADRIPIPRITSSFPLHRSSVHEFTYERLVVLVFRSLVRTLPHPCQHKPRNAAIPDSALPDGGLSTQIQGTTRSLRVPGCRCCPETLRRLQ